ncbi:MAG: NAD(P)/FAD-dependent oxidoreductase [Aquificae bacterium]|nr:NAD(P)/FAD-dependent oxidoreductase [Aquificota bacterium]
MFDLTVIGTGPGGFEAVMTALRMGLNIAVVEKGKLGGNCLNRACIPTKYYRSAVHLYQKLPKVERYGIDLDIKGISFPKAKEGKDKAISFLRKSFSQLLKTKKVPVYKGIGRIIDKHTVKVEMEDGSIEQIQSRYILIATGSVPATLGLQVDGERIITTEDFLENLSTLPKDMVIIGGGVAGVEIGYLSAVYGSSITIVEAKDRLLSGLNIPKEGLRLLNRKLKELKIQIKTETTVEKIENEGDRLKVSLSNGESITTDKVLLSVGRVPNTSQVDGIGLSKDERGFLKVNQYLQTDVENIYACGDVVNSPMLAHTSSMEARVCINNMFNSKKEKPDYSLIPWAVFSAVELAQVGLSEENAKEIGLQVETALYPFTYNEKAVDELENEGIVKLVFEKESKKILGGFIAGSQASELIHFISLAIKKGLTAQDIHHFVYFHPSLSEIFTHTTYDITTGKLF